MARTVNEISELIIQALKIPWQPVTFRFATGAHAQLDDCLTLVRYSKPVPVDEEDDDALSV